MKATTVLNCRRADSAACAFRVHCVETDAIGCYGVTVWERPPDMATVYAALGGRETMQWTIRGQRRPRGIPVRQCGACGNAVALVHGSGCQHYPLEDWYVPPLHVAHPPPPEERGQQLGLVEVV